MDFEYNNNMCPHHESFKIYNNGKKGFEYQGNLFYGLRMESFVKREKNTTLMLCLILKMDIT